MLEDPICGVFLNLPSLYFTFLNIGYSHHNCFNANPNICISSRSVSIG